MAGLINEHPRIMVATSGSVETRAAVDYALGLAGKLSGALVVLAIDPASMDGDPENPPDPREVLNRMPAHLRQELEAIAAHARPAGISVRYRGILHGHPLTALLGAIHEYEPSLLVLGAPTRTLLDRLSLGISVDDLWCRCAVPVLVVPADVGEAS